jgi:hypothetical protein
MKKSIPRKLENIVITLPSETLIIFMDQNEVESFRDKILEELYDKLSNERITLMDRFIGWLTSDKNIKIKLHKIDVHLSLKDLR